MYVNLSNVYDRLIYMWCICSVCVVAAYGQSPRLQESCDPSSVLVCSGLHLCLTSIIIEFMHRPFRNYIVIHSLDKKKLCF